MAEEKKKRKYLPHILTGIIYFMITAIVCQLIILFDLINLGNTYCGGGFFSAGSGIVFRIYGAIFAIIVISVFLKLFFKRILNKGFWLIINIAIAIITAILVYRINLKVFENVDLSMYRFNMSFPIY